MPIGNYNNQYIALYKGKVKFGTIIAYYKLQTSRKPKREESTCTGKLKIGKGIE